MKKAISYMACSMAAMLALSACGSAASSASTVASSSDAASTESTAASEASNEPVTITFAQYSGSGDNEQYLQQMVDNYMKENPNVTIDLQTYGYDDYFTQMTAKVSGGQAPDVFELDYQNFVSYAKKGALMPLDDILTKDGIDTSIYNDMALKAFSADGVQYGVPDSFSNVVLIYNKDLFDQAGIDYPTDDWKWEDREDAVKRSLCIHNLDGTPYKIPEGHWFPGSMIPDFTNPETCITWFGKRQYLLDMGVDGFKTDGGEFVCTDAVSFYDGSTGKESRNYYPQQYTKAYTQFLGNNHVLFSRAGYMGQHTTPCHWGGDQQSTNDELRHVLSAGLSAALSGILFWGFDLAGFAGPLPTLDLYRRATMLACFTPIMQWHSEPGGGQFKELMPGGEGNNERSPWNMAAVYNSPEFVTEMRFWHWLRMNLQPYLIATAFRCAAEKVPMMRPLVYEWPQDKAARQVEDEFLLGDAILVAPLLEENQTAREVYLPEGEWYVFFTGKCYHGYQTISTTADMKFPVFIRGGYAVPLHADGMDSLGNPVSQNLNSKLILLVAGAAGKSTFTTNKSVLTCEWKNEKVRVEGTGAETVQIHHFC